MLNLPITANIVSIGTIDNQTTNTKGITRITIGAIHSHFWKEMICFILPTIADTVPAEFFPRNCIKIPPKLKLADPEFYRPRAIDVLIGAGTTLSLFSVGQINLSMNNDDFYLQKTRLGWLVAGSLDIKAKAKHICKLTSLEHSISQFWVMNELPERRTRSIEEATCENHYTKNISRANDGRYTVRLPFQEENEIGQDSRAIAFKRLLLLERKFKQNEILEKEYTRVIKEYISLGHMTLAAPVEGPEYYMPHHAVLKQTSQTTKVRVVFDASAKTHTNKSLNDVLLVGPTIQEPLTVHLMKFRTYAYVITADIEKMYRQVWVHQDDRKYQRILWRQDNEIKQFELNTLTFGVAASPFLAIRTLHQLADDEIHSYPKAATILKTHMYVDDLLTGTNSIDEARKIRDEIIALLKLGGFEIRQWASNDKQIVSDLASSINNTEFTLKTEPSLKTLGLMWRTTDDRICYNPHQILQEERLTKRSVLSEIAKIFDPLGLIGPVVLYAKKLMQELWKTGIHWDETIPPEVYTKWQKFTSQWNLLEEIAIQRNIIVNYCINIQLHGFCDASNNGFGACIYIRSQNKRGKTICHLVNSKSRVAPIKPLTIPRLELCGAALLAKLYQEVIRALSIESINKVVLWSDSTIALQWIRTAPHLLQTFVSNRVAVIQDLTDKNIWRHVRTNDNPADAISRGQLPREFVENQLWFSGPSWLLQSEDHWPNLQIDLKEIPEVKKNSCLHVTLTDTNILTKYSSYNMLIRIVAYCLRWTSPTKIKGPLIINELRIAEVRVLKLLQIDRFKIDIQALKGSVAYRGKLLNLDPFLDKDGLIRVGGRLTQSNLNFSQKHPILLPNRHHLTDCISRETHVSNYHTGIQATLYNIRQKFWLADSRNQIRKIIKNCVRCFRFRSDVSAYKMGNLPSYRVNQTVPFSHTGIDYCGPFYIKEKKFRNRNKIKCYVCVFVCLVIKAVHLEIVSDLITEGFIAALRRFISRRGIPDHIHSDNGKNFVGANNQLKELHMLFNSDNHKIIVNKFAIERHITWHFIPPLAPHFGGLWEATVKVFKHHFKRVIGETMITFEELNTFATEVEGILNSRPIAAISTDPNDLQPITPAHYLIGKPITTLPEGDLSSVPENRLSTWQHVTKMRQNFWSRWRLEYLNELQARGKWKTSQPNITIGSLALIKDKVLPCSRWALGRVEAVHPGLDGVVRTVTLKTNSGSLKRTSNTICVLPNL